MKKKLLFLIFATLGLSLWAQRQMETLNRGLVAVKTSSGVFTSWRIDGTEYYDTKYNLYRDGTLVNSEPLDVSNYTDAAGDASSTYTVAAVVRGEEQEQCEAVSVWSTQYLEIPMSPIYSRNGTDLSTDYILNDACAADLDGDGEMEIVVKRLYSNEDLYYSTNDSAFAFVEGYKLDGTRLWSIDVGPNMISSGQVELNCVAYDWDQDGAAELIMRAADDCRIYAGDGNTYIVGDSTANYRDDITHSSNMTYSVSGDEFLVYMNGETAVPYFDPIEYPLKRLESNESDLSDAWGDAYGHRSNKFFFGAPYLDGRNPSIFLARGIYTRHKMIAYDVDPDSHELTKRWTWNCSDSSSDWYGQGYHNFGIADVDLDGRDEIVYGSMVIDDNGNGLSTTGLGHGDAQHCGDLDPYRKGLEIFACNEDAQGSNYRDATTSQIYYFDDLGRDCGRCIAGNFTEDYPGAQCVATGTNLLSAVTDTEVSSSTDGIDTNFEIFWDGDLCSETINGEDTEGACVVHKYGSWTGIFTASGTKMCNYTKNTPTLQADILGDWREEIILRSEDDQTLRIYTTTDETAWRNYTLLHDIQYRQAVVWQMCGYNQPPHVSYFLGESDGYTMAPPPLMTNGRTEVESSITSANNDEHVILCNTDGGNVSIASGAEPYILTVYAFSHTEGNDDNDNIVTELTEYTIDGTLSGETRLVKQGEGILNLSGTHTHSGETDLWGGITNLEGSFSNSDVNMYRFAELNANGEMENISMEYGAVLRVGGEDNQGTLTADSLTLAFGAVVEFDIYGDLSSDTLVLNDALAFTTETRTNGPEYSAPVFRFVQHLADGTDTMTPGLYCIAKVSSIDGDLDKIEIEGLEGLKATLESDGEYIYLNIVELRSAATIYWTGAYDSSWDLATTTNFADEDGEEAYFVTGDTVVFNDNASSFSVQVKEDVTPSQVIFRNDSNTYSLSGSYAITGDASLIVEGSGQVNINNTNSYTGQTLLKGGKTRVASLGNSITADGSLGAYTTETGFIQMSGGAILYNTADVTNGTPITIGEGGATIQNEGSFTMEAAIDGNEALTKTGSGTLSLISGNDLKTLTIASGTLSHGDDENAIFADTIIFSGDATYYDYDNWYSYSTNANNFKVEEGADVYFYLDGRSNYTGKLYGFGHAYVNIDYVRSYLQGDWSNFEGILEPINTDYSFTLANSYGIPNATLNIPEDVYVENSSSPYSIGIVSGEGTLGGETTWKIGSLNEDFTFNATISGEGSLVKIGTGTMTVKSSNSFTGTCTVSEGILCINNSSADEAMLGTGALTVEAGAEMCGIGFLDNSSVEVSSGGVLYPGRSKDASTGSIDFNNNSVVIDEGGELSFSIASKTRCTSLENMRRLTVQGSITINVKSSATLSEGDEFQLWDANHTSLTSTYSFSADTPGDGLDWDTTDLESGIIRVTASADAISGILADTEADYEVYTVGGARLGGFTFTGTDLNKAMKNNGFAAGVYLLKVTQGDSQVVQKIVVD